jgi:hypothetical protein
LTVRLRRADRRRLAFASVLTVIALPAVWLANRDDDRRGQTRPNVAAVGLDAAGGGGDQGGPTTSVDPMGTMDPLFAGEPTEQPAGPVSAAVGSAESVIVGTPLATYSRSVIGDACRYNGVAAGTAVTVLNPANGRTIDCVTAPSDEDELTLHPDRFAQIADVTAGPVRVEVHQE